MVINRDDGCLQCQCEICSCSCQVLFRQHDRAKIALNENKRYCEGSFEDNTSAGYFHKTLLDCLSNGAITASHESGTDEDISRNGASFAALDIITNPLLQQNVGLCKSMQAEIEPMSSQKMKEIRRGIARSNLGPKIPT